MQQFSSWLKLPSLQLDISSQRIIHSFKTALACMIGYALYLFAPLPQSQWIVITILVVMSAQTNIGSLSIKALMRFWGTVCGALAAAVIIVLCDDQPVALTIALFVSVLVFTYIATTPGDVSYVGTLGSVTVIVIVLSYQPTLLIAVERFIEIFLGIIIAFLVSRFVLPIRSYDIFIDNLAKSLLDLHDYFDASFQENGVEFTEYSLAMNEKIMSILSNQRRLIHEMGMELAKFRQDKTLFQQVLNSERKIFRAISIMSYSFHAVPENQHIIQSLPGFIRFVVDVSQYLVELSQAVRSPSAQQEFAVLDLDWSELILDDVRKIKLNQDYPHIINLHAFLFEAKFLINELKHFTRAMQKMHTV